MKLNNDRYIISIHPNGSVLVSEIRGLIPTDDEIAVFVDDPDDYVTAPCRFGAMLYGTHGRDYSDELTPINRIATELTRRKVTLPVRGTAVLCATEYGKLFGFKYEQTNQIVKELHRTGVKLYERTHRADV